MTTILGIAGSLRRNSFNRAILDNARPLMPTGATLEVAGVDGIPLYDGDVEEHDGLPAAVTELKSRICAADGVVLASPEYNTSVPGVLKNTMDWLSRPPEDIARVFAGRPVAVIGATPGPLGTILAQTAWLPVLRTLRMRHWAGGRLMVSAAHERFDSDGVLTDEATGKALAEFMAGFVDFVRRG